MGCDAQLALSAGANVREKIMSAGKSLGTLSDNVRTESPEGQNVQILMQDYKYLRVAIMICPPVNTHRLTDIHTRFWPATYSLARLAEIKIWQLAFHCHLKPPVAPVIIGFHHQSHNSPSYTNSSKIGTICGWVIDDFTNFHGPFLGGGDFVRPRSHSWLGQTIENLRSI